jgi:hypothetical protein
MTADYFVFAYADIAQGKAAQSMAQHCNRDESLFYTDYILDCIWTSFDKNSPSLPTGQFHSKNMLTILWNPREFHIVKILPHGISFIAAWFIDQILQPLVERFFSRSTKPGQKKLISSGPKVHASASTAGFWSSAFKLTYL